ncbi:ankyrin repeat domain-containing protein 26 [Alosa sapidissima]|uniref:ankyrin repeat domain-containing protein 26 n=1 Tax=Alosa sapidissima TaxID=34773 RepID=UPI001C08A3BE|nr:ankyrin repeat domain-containing protein 26 [Alosa sapidissima]
MKKIFHFTKKKKSFSPNASDTTSVLSVGYDLKEKDLGKVHKAAAAGDVVKVKQLAKKNDLNQLDKENRTALHIACVNGHAEVVQFLVESKVKLNLCDNQNRSALMKAVQCQQDRCVAILLEHEADPNLVDIKGSTALHLAARIPSLSVAVLLLEHEANINAQNKDGNTPLILSVEENHPEMAELLLKEGADVDLINLEHRSALMMASCNGQISMVRLLLQYNADITIKDDKGWTSDDYAVMNGHHACSHLIIEHGTKHKYEQSPSHHNTSKKKRSVLGSVSGDMEAGFSLGGPATDKDELQLSGAMAAGRDIEDNSQTDSISRASKSGPADSWPSSDEDDALDLSPKKPEKVNLKKLLSASKKDHTEVLADPDKLWSGDESEHGSLDGAERNPPLLRAPLLNSTPKHPVAPSPFSKPPQMTSFPVNQSQKENVSVDEDDDDDDDDGEEEEEDEEEEEEDGDKSNPEEETETRHGTDTSVMKNKASPKPQQRDFLSELGLEKGDGDDDSPWDSESASESPRKQHGRGPTAPAKAHSTMSNISGNSEDLLYIPSFIRESRNSYLNTWGGIGRPARRREKESRGGHENVNEEDKCEGTEDTVPVCPQQPAVMRRETVSVLSKLMDAKGQSDTKTDLMEELGLGDVDDLEDGSDWDSASTASKASPSYRLDEEPERDTSSIPVLSVLQEQDPGPPGPGEVHRSLTPEKRRASPSATSPLPSPRLRSTLSPLRPKPQIHTLKPASPRPESEEGSDWDSESSAATSPTKTAKPLPKTVNTDAVLTPAFREPSPVEEGTSDVRIEENPEQDTDALYASDFGLNLSQCQLPPMVSQTGGEEEDLQDAFWEKNYEKIWVEFEKRETKSQYKNVAAELKEMFGELTPNESGSPEGCAAKDKQQEKDMAPSTPKSEVSIVEGEEECKEDAPGQTLEGEGNKKEREGIVKKDLKHVAVAEHEPENEVRAPIEVPSADEPGELEDESENKPAVVVRTVEEEPSEEEDEIMKEVATSAVNAEETEEVEVRVSPAAEDSSDEDDDDDDEVVITRPIARARSIMLHPIPEQRESSGQEDSQSEESPRPLQPPEKEVCKDVGEEALTKAPVEDREISLLSPDPPRYTLEAESEVHHTNQSDGDRTVKPRSQPHNDDFILAKSESKANRASSRATPSQVIHRSSTQNSVEYRSRQTLETDRKNSGPRQEVPQIVHSTSSLRPSTPSRLSEEELQLDLQRFKHKTSEEFKAMVEENNTSILKDPVKGSNAQHEHDLEKGMKFKTNPGNPKPQQEGAAGNPREHEFKIRDSVAQKLQTSTTKSPRSTGRSPAQEEQPGGGAEEEQELKALGSQGSPEGHAMEQARALQHTAHLNGDRLSVFDDSTLSEVSEDEGRSPLPAQNIKSAGEVDMADDLDDLTQSSDTGTEELDSPSSGYRHASMLIKQLDSTSIDSVSMVKLQNMFQEYEHTIHRERSRHSRLAEKMSQLEQERTELRLLLEETRDSQSNLVHLKMELETELNNLRFLLKQEQEKHHNASMLYDKTREQLRRKEEQQRLEEEQKQKVELTIRNLELEKRTLINSMKQLEDDRNEAQRQLAQERSTRALQEEMLNSHRRKQQEIEEENRKNVVQSKEVLSQLTEASDREREMMTQVGALQEELLTLRAELEREQASSRQEEGRLSEEGEALRERLEDTRRDLKLSEEALAQAVFQYNGQLSALKAECQVTAGRLEQERTSRQQLETEAESVRVRLSGALQEVERCQAARAEAERALQREREERQRALEKRAGETGAHRDTVHELSQKLGQAEARANSLETECHRATLALTEKGLLLDTAAREREQALVRLREAEAALQAEREQATRAGARQEATQERLAQAQSEGALLRQQLEEVQSKGMVKERAVTDAQERFSDILDKLRSDCEERVQLIEERSKELAEKNADLRDQNHKLDQEKADRETALRQLQQELADSLKKLSMCEASLEVNTRYRSDLEEEKARTLKDMDRLKTKLQESEDQFVQAERRINSLKCSLDEKEREVIASSQKLQEVLSASAASEKTIKQLEEAMQRLEIDNARLEAAAKQQSNRLEVLQKGTQEAAAPPDSSAGGGVRTRLEDLVTNLQSSKMTLEDQLNREVQKQSLLSHTVQDSQALWEEELKSRSRIGIRLAELEKEKGELSTQMELERKKAKKIGEQKKSVDTRLEQEMKRNTELQKEMYRLKTLVKTAKKKLREQDGGELASPLTSLRGDLGQRQSDTESAISRMKAKVDELQLQLEKEASRCSRLEQVNGELKEQLAALKGLSRSHERLERSKRQLEEELSGLRRQVESGVMDQSQAEQYRRETEDRARQEIRHKLEEVNLFLQTQAASQEALEQIKAANEASQRTQLEQRIKELEVELARTRSTQQDSAMQRESSRAELERYRQLYADELRLRKSLAAKLDRCNERLAEANTKLLSERHRSKSLIASSIVNGSLGAPSVEVGSLGSLGAYGGTLGPLNRSLGLGGTLLGTVDPQTSRVEAYLAKMQSELEKNISKELDHATAELDGASPRLSPVGSACGSQKSLALDQDPVSRATQQYLEVLKKNYMI